MPWDDPDAVALRLRQEAEIHARFADADAEPGVRPRAADVVAFVLVRDRAGVALGCGGIRAIDARTGEIKRMYTAPDARGRGVGRMVLAELERIGRTHGWTRMLLETGEELPEAVGLYTACGYTRTDNYGPYVGEPLSVCFGKDLVPR
ncbi:GNAT family N-acetyltransferase [Nakamurella sp. YIM 132087]|uniref:GNAT family N-acetyltransferase n=1 Tax=Nakamurella alba TaxID=2665158 RepID=A0A7K1FJL2_9ACTN|nr:GNAT family N-acetyltransferase [Nakamurella alba]